MTKTTIDYIAFGDSVVVENNVIEKTEGGIIIPDASQERKTFLKVVATGDLVKGIEVGDEVTFVHYASATGITLPNKEKYLSFHQGEVIGKLLVKELAN